MTATRTNVSVYCTLVLVLGSGHSAFTVLLDLVALAERMPGTTVFWGIRRRGLGSLFGGGEADALPERGRLGQRLRALVESGRLVLFQGFPLERITREARVRPKQAHRQPISPEY